MANIKSAAKRARQTLRKTARNRIVLSGLKTALKEARLAKTSGKSSKKADSQNTVKNAVSKIMKAASKGVIHKNTAARYVSRLTKT